MQVCGSCGGQNVSELQWRDLNDGSLVEGTPDRKCWDCNELVEVVSAGEYVRREHDAAADDRRDSARDNELINELHLILTGAR